ncbi:MAG: hypothetical protein EXR66_03310 [Dehalococcoidia bacterium]|nr:hypothetical protein [Dehalococcoidia bacterium]
MRLFPRRRLAGLRRLPLLLAATAAILALPPAAAFGAPLGSEVINTVDPIDVPVASRILGLAIQAVGTYQGECFPWVRRLVSQATGAAMGSGYRDGYLSAGAVEVALTDARAGDIIQLIDDADAGRNADYNGMHTSIAVDVLGAGRFRVIDSNLGFDGVVRVRDDYNPIVLAARFARINVHVYRFGQPTPASAADAPRVPTASSNQPIGNTTQGGSATSPQQSTSSTAVIRADGDCLRLRAAPSTSAPVLTCLADGSTVTLRDGTQQADGVAWQAVSAGGRSGWVASQYLVKTGGAPAVLPTAQPTPAPSAPVSTAPPAAAPQTGSGSIIGEVPSGGGIALVVFSGGSVESLLGVTSERGCHPVSVWASPAGGGLVGMIAGAPSVVNREWNALFPSGSLGASTPLLLVCRGGPVQLAAAAPSAAAPSSGPADRGAGPPGPAGNQ